MYNYCKSQPSNPPKISVDRLIGIIAVVSEGQTTRAVGIRSKKAISMPLIMEFLVKKFRLAVAMYKLTIIQCMNADKLAQIDICLATIGITSKIPIIVPYTTAL